MKQVHAHIWYHLIAYENTNGAIEWIFEFPPRTPISRLPTPTLLWLLWLKVDI